MRTKIVAGLLLGAVIVAGLVMMQRGSVVDGQAQRPRPEAKPSLPSEGQATNASCGWQIGEQRAWQITAQRTATLDLAAFGFPGDDPRLGDIHVDTQAMLQVQTLSVTATDAVLLARLWDVDAETSTRAGDLTAPFLLRVGNDCAVRGFARYQGTALLPARTQQAILADLWFSVPVTERQEINGYDATGPFHGVVARDAQTTQRRVLRYQRLWDTQAHGPVTVDNSLLTVRRDAGPWFASMTGQHITRGGGLGRSETRLTVTRQPVAVSTFLAVPRDESMYIWEDLLPRVIEAPQAAGPSARELAEREKLKHVPPELALQRFELNLRTHSNINEQWRDLSLYMEARPDTIPMFQAKLQHDELPVSERPAAYVALGKARVPEARDALLAINADLQATVVNRSQTALLLTNRNDVDASFAERLSVDASQHALSGATPQAQAYARDALLAVGMMANVQATRLPGVADTARSTIARALTQSSTPSDLSPVFGAMGNLGDVSMLSQIRSYAFHPDPDVRMRAVRSIRRMPLSAVNGLLVDWLTAETASGPKREIYSNLRDMVREQGGQLDGSLVPLAISDLSTHPGIITRQALYRLLGPLAATNASVKQALVAQVPLEMSEQQGAFNLLTRYLPSSDVALALSSSP